MTMNVKMTTEREAENLMSNLLAPTPIELDPIDVFSKKNFIGIPPPTRRKKSGFLIENKSTTKTNYLAKNKNYKLYTTYDNYEIPVHFQLAEIFKSYTKKFDEICRKVINEKYECIFNEIYEFIRFMRHVREPTLRTIVLNTDQNANDFFDSMEEYFSLKFEEDKEIENSYFEKLKINSKRLVFLNEDNFSDLKVLFNFLQLSDEDYFNNSKSLKFERLIIIRGIQKIDKLSLNILIGRIIDYHQDPERIYTNYLIFDVSYDPRTLFEKIKPNHLCKMVFSNIENIPSKNIYQEVLYKFIFENHDHLFVPHSINLKKIVDYVKDHQISIKSFKHYFKFLLIDFFLIKSWSRDEYLIYSLKINPKKTSDENLNKFFKTELERMYDKVSLDYNHKLAGGDVDYLVDMYKKEKNNRDLFFLFYKFLENLIVHLNTLDKSQKYLIDPFQFFFDFLQLGSNFDKVCLNRTDILKTSLERLKPLDYITITKNIILPQLNNFIESENILEKFSHNLDNVSESEEKLKLLNFMEKLENLCKSSKGEDLNKKMANLKNTRSNLIINDQQELPSDLNNDDFLKNMLKLFKEIFFRLNFFGYLSKTENRLQSTKTKRSVVNGTAIYMVFTEVVNPSFSYVVMEALLSFDKQLEESKKRKSNRKSTRNANEDVEMSDWIEPINRENFKENYKFSTLYKHFIVLFSQAPSEFKLKFLFAEYLDQFEVDYENKETVFIMKNHFLYFCHVFYLLGFITKKRVKNDIFMKNYFQITNFFKK